MNTVQLIGNLGRDPEFKQLNGGGMLANFSVATSEKYKDKTTGEDKEITTWHRCVAFGKTAEIVQERVTKGSKVFVLGSLTVNKWEDKDGNKRETVQVRVDKVEVLARSQGLPGGSAPRAPAAAQSAPAEMDSDIPF